MSKRKAPNLTVKLASALLALGDIPYLDAKQMSAEQIISLYQFDHGILHAIEVNDEFWNFTPRLIKPHREKSKKDTAIVAKVKRIEVNRPPAAGQPIEEGRPLIINGLPRQWPSGRKLQSRGFPKRGKKR